MVQSSARSRRNLLKDSSTGRACTQRRTQPLRLAGADIALTRTAAVADRVKCFLQLVRLMRRKPEKEAVHAHARSRAGGSRVGSARDSCGCGPNRHHRRRWRCPHDGEPTSFQLFGDGTRLSSDSFGSGVPQGLRAGQSVVIHGGLRTTNTANSHHPVSATVNGTVYPSVWLFGSLAFLGAPFVVPPGQAGAFINDFQTTFTMNGHLEGFSDVDGTQPAGARLFAVDVTGSGVAHIGPYRATSDNVWNSFDGGASFLFEAASPSPTPEPATMVLLASGLVIAGAAVPGVTQLVSG